MQSVIDLSVLVVVFLAIFSSTNGFALPGKIDVELDKEHNSFAIPNRGFYNNTQIQLKINCQLGNKVRLGWLLRLSECINEFYVDTERLPEDIFENIYRTPNMALLPFKEVRYIKKNLTEYHCEDVGLIIDLYSHETLQIIREPVSISPIRNPNRSRTDPSALVINKRDDHQSSLSSSVNTNTSNAIDHTHHEFETIVQTWQDGAYLFMLETEPVDGKDYNLKVTVSFKYKSGYLSAIDWPLLPFFAVMCAIYSIFALFWFICSLCYWRDLLRIQIWIGAVILLGLMEKAAYLAEYDQINKNGYTFKVAMLVAEVISCFKRSLARMLVIVVSLGFGIVKPRLGTTMQKVVAIGSLYFVFALIDGVFRILDRKEDTDSKGVLAGVPLVFIDVSICYWILSNLQQTMRTLRVRRNIPKLSLYRHFTNTLIFCVIASIVFMIWSLIRHRFVNCLKDWKELWLDEGFWHILFSFILLIIIILWRPSNNSQRFAFTPLIDNEDDYDEDDNNDQENEIFDSIKMRSAQSSSKSALAEKKDTSLEDDLKWVEENVPATLAETALPNLADSEEEIMTTRFEASKMD